MSEKVKYSYAYDKENDLVTVSKVSTFHFTHYHRDLLLQALSNGYVEIRGKFLEIEEYSKAYHDLTQYNLLKNDLDGWYDTGTIINKEESIKLVKSYTEEI